MISTHRSQSSFSSRRPSISNPIPADRFVPLSPPATKSPPPTNTTTTAPSPPRSRSALAGSMARNWLARASSSSSGSSGSGAPYAPSKPRGVVLGSGAIVVRTPQEALAGSSVSVYDDEDDTPTTQTAPRSTEHYQLPASPTSPPLPPIPDFEDDEEEEGKEPEQEYRERTQSRSSTPSRPTRAPPPIPIEENAPVTSPPLSLRPSLKSCSPPNSEYFPPVPALPANVPPSPPQMPFEPILLSPAPVGTIDPSKIIVSVETCTNTFRTTLQTLTSRPSFLSTYLKSLLPSKEGDDDEVSVRSAADSAFNSIFHHHLTSSGLLTQTSTNIHIFLDRPSAPYAHVLTYLRTPPSTPEHPAILPRAVQLNSSSNSRLEALLELRDEARYLDLDELYKLCTDEIRVRQDSHRNNMLGLHTHSRAMSNASMMSGRSLGTLRETPEHETEVSEMGERKLARTRSRDSGLGSGSPPSTHAKSPSPRNSESPDIWNSSPPVMVNASALQQRLQLTGRGRSETRKEAVASSSTRPVGRWL
ncbi:unnamed protein product [Somion occarium]|uniref:BTB domain-containing protein n=1 Tax=Somion occarium TaxID=3059160 RepID=A0ABP1CYK0_9APHY